MIIHPDLLALRGDDTPQRVAQAATIAAMAEWRAAPDVAAVLADIERFAEGRAIGDVPALAALFADDSAAAAALVGGFVAAMVRVLAGQPLGHVAARHFTDGVVSSLLLARSANVTLTLAALDGEGLSRRPDPVTADFAPCDIRERVLAGRAEAEVVRCLSADAHAARLERSAARLAPGMVLARDAATEALQVRRVSGCLVTLRLQRRRSGDGVTREYRLADGVLVHQAAGNPRDSRMELMMALLGRMGRSDAAPILGEIAREPGSTALRWQALRECLALDTASGFAALCDVARASGDPLAGAAGSLRAQLIESHPQLLELEPCPA